MLTRRSEVPPANCLELCRLCLVKDRVKIPIFEGEGDVRQIFLKITACLPVKITKEDRLPKRICDDCMVKVELLYQFWNTATNAEKQLLEWLGETPDQKTVTVVKVESDVELSKSLSHVEAVLDARDAGSDTDHFADATKIETDSEDDVPLSALEATAFVNVTPVGEPSTSASADASNSAQTQNSGSDNILPKKYVRRKKVLDRGGPRKCSKCDYVAVLHRMIVHERRHSGERPFRCKVCNASFTAAGTLNKHYQTHVSEKRWECDVCKKKFKLKNALYIHKKMHTDGKKYFCEVCGYAAYQKSNLDIHKRRHLGQYKFTCPECKKGFYNKQEFENHKNTHSGKKPFFCPEESCTKRYPIQSSLYYHINSVHNPDAANKPKNHQCEVCLKAFSSRSRLIYHQRTHSVDRRPFACNMCDKKLCTQESLNEHLRTHSGVKNKRSGDKPFYCEYCSKNFTSASSLSIHVKSHVAQKPYICEPCNLSFVSKTLFSSHQKTSHPLGSWQISTLPLSGPVAFAVAPAPRSFEEHQLPL